MQHGETKFEIIIGIGYKTLITLLVETEVEIRDISLHAINLDVLILWMLHRLSIFMTVILYIAERHVGTILR